MDELNSYLLNKPYCYEDRRKPMKNPFNVKNVSGALGVVLARRMIPVVSSGREWAIYCSWIEDTRNLWTCYKKLLSLPVDTALQEGVAPSVQVPDCLWAGNVAGFIFLANLSWDDTDEEMREMRLIIQKFANTPVKGSSEYSDLLLQFLKLLRAVNDIGMREVQVYEPGVKYYGKCNALRVNRHEYYGEENYRKAHFVDVISHVLDIVKEKDPGIRKIFHKAELLEDRMLHITCTLFYNLLLLQMKEVSGSGSGRDYRVRANEITALLNRIDKVLTA